MKKLILFFSILCFTFMHQEILHSQVVQQWAKRYSLPGIQREHPYLIAADASGNIYCGLTIYTGNNTDISVIKYDQNGDTAWITTYGGNLNRYDYPICLKLDASGNVLVSGAINSHLQAGKLGSSPFFMKLNSITGDTMWTKNYKENYSYGAAEKFALDQSGNILSTGWQGNYSGTNQIPTRKLNSSGDPIWTHRYGPPSSDDISMNIVQNASGDIYVAGTLHVPTQSNIFLKKYSSSGAEIWTVTYNGSANKSDDIAWNDGIALDGDGNIYLAGFVNNNSTWTWGGNIDMVLLKYNSSGVLQWSRIYAGDGTGFDFANALIIDDENNIYVSATSKVLSSDKDYLLLKYNTNGDTIWTRRYYGAPHGPDYGEYGLDMVLDKYNNIYLCGLHRVANPTNDDGIVYKYDPDGNLVWSQSYHNSTLDSADYFYKMSIDSSGNIICVGESFYSTSGGLDMILVKYTQAPYYPEELSATAISTSAINLSWLDVSGNEIAFKIERSTDDSIWTPIDSIPANSTFYADTGLASNTIYYYRINAFNAAGESNYSNTAFDTTFNAVSILELTILIEGFYNTGTNTMVQDTLRVYLHNNFSPYSLVDSSISYLDSLGTANFTFTNAAEGVNYYIRTKHRNALETWSKSPGQSFSSSYMAYDFTPANSQAFGNNMKLIDTSPLKFAIYSGDVDQNGIVDGSDAAIIDNDAYNFVTGYVVSDVTGDEITDGSDAAIVDNNAYNFVSKATP